MKTVYTYEVHNLGDQIVFLHLLRTLARQSPETDFVHFCGAHHHSQLHEVVRDIPNILLSDFESPLWRQQKNEAICVWKNHQDVWVDSPLRWDWSNFTLWHHKVTARRMGFDSPFTCREHLLLDYPALEPEEKCPPVDFLIVNSEPCSGQFTPMAQHGSGYLDELICKLAANHTVMVTNPVEGCVRTPTCTREAGLTISQIGALSVNCRHHIMVASGPMWPTLNTHSHHNSDGRVRIALLDNGEKLNMPGIIQMSNVRDVMLLAESEGWIS